MEGKRFEKRTLMLKKRKRSNGLKPLFPYPALLIKDNEKKRTLIVADLHIGFEYSLAQEGIYLPSQTSKITDKLLKILNEYELDELIILGDVKQTIPKISLGEWRDVPEFFDKISTAIKKVSIILGNHDGNLEPLIPPTIKILPSTGIIIGKNIKIGLFHGHAWPKPEVLASDILVMGHIHPIVKFFDGFGFTILRQVWMKAKCKGDMLAKAYLKYSKIKDAYEPNKQFYRKFGVKMKDPILITMPAFNEALGGMTVNKRKKKWLGPVLSNCEADINNADLYLLDGTYLSTIASLPTRF